MDIKQSLLEQYKYRIELHAHTVRISPCSRIEPKEMVRIYKEKGYDAVVITNHFHEGLIENEEKEAYIERYLSGYFETLKAAEGTGLKIILGAEVRFNENFNDYLIYGVDREILSKSYDYFKKGVEAFREEVKLPESVFIQAHPMRDGMTLCNPSILDGVETFNMHPGHNSRVGLTVRYAYENGLKIKTAGSDFHHPNKGHEAVSALRTKTLPNDSFELAQILKSGDYIFEIGENSIVLP